MFAENAGLISFQHVLPVEQRPHLADRFITHAGYHPALALSRIASTAARLFRQSSRVRGGREVVAQRSVVSSST